MTAKPSETDQQKEYREIVERIASNIANLCKAVEALLHGPLKRKALVILLANSSGQSQASVDAVLRSLETMRGDWLNKWWTMPRQQNLFRAPKKAVAKRRHIYAQQNLDAAQIIASRPDLYDGLLMEWAKTILESEKPTEPDTRLDLPREAEPLPKEWSICEPTHYLQRADGKGHFGWKEDTDTTGLSRTTWILWSGIANRRRVLIREMGQTGKVIR
jgi:hypothetical protein